MNHQREAEMAEAYARLSAMIDARLLDIQALEQQVAELRAVLAAWGNIAKRWKVETPTPTRPAMPRPPRKVNGSLSRDAVVELIRARGGPMHWRELLQHFGRENGKASVGFRAMARAGVLVNHGDGFFGLPTERNNEGG